MEPLLLSGAPTEYVGGRNGSLSTDVKGTTWVSGEENGSAPHPRECSPTKRHLSEAQGTHVTVGDSKVPGAECPVLSEQEFSFPLNLRKPVSSRDLGSTRNCFSFSYKLCFGASASVLSEGKHGPM